MEMNTLFIFDEAESGAALYLLPDDEVALYKEALDACQDKFAGSDPYMESMGIVAALVCDTPQYVSEEFKKHAGRWTKFRIDTRKRFEGLVRTVYFSGSAG